MSNTKKLISFVGLTIAMFMGTLDSTIINIALPSIMDQFHASLNDTSWVTTIYTLALAVFMITGSKLADRYGRKKLMLIGLVLFGGFSAACMFAPSLLALIVFRFFQGIGGAIITPIVLPMGIEIFGKENTSKISSVVGAITALAAAGGPPIGGVILQYGSWRGVFGINLPLSILALLIVVFFIQESYDNTLSGKIDWFGMLALSVSLGGIVFGLLEGRQLGWHSVIIVTSLVIGVLALLVFYLIEKRVAEPLIELDLIKEKTFTASSLVYFVTGFSLVCPMLIINYFLQDLLNYSALHAALIIIPVSLTVVVAMPLGTKIFDAMGAKWVTGIGLLLIAGSLGLLSLIKMNTPTIIIVVFLIINGFGFGFSSVSLVASVQYLPKEKTGIGSGIVNSMRQIGTCLGMALLVTVLNNNVLNAKNEIRSDAVQTIQTHRLAPQVQNVAEKEVKRLFKTNSKGKNIKTKTSGLQKKIKRVAQQTNNLPEPAKKSSLGIIYQKQKMMTDGTRTLNTGLTKLVKDSNNPLLTATGGLVKGQQKMLTGIKLLAQKNEIRTTLRDIKKQKNKKLTAAFSKTYLLAAIIVLLCSPIALLTDYQKKKVA
ncbi:DHA2 family efflux MFS transporter permease subunit (plasmid) [Bombilactobacillus folatiphilus]|uniref:DHA2 family efflux MFS transporter permease subunit n=1 Tax=Bombilactobacillus folatiphilus TaxID=2923362 RepID=A0ABY4PAQ1_9LACO|nr:MFS transporter [Bombilactobacillus folatiphilus]UQS81439.1 DHA2 family efflux MFS transporter permease subunit [Bombilactobacillus folatiphilus]UQS82828.1 DHA2 family efflux MFS transporter permease subunit [Bombilactobacillus folatiphilus]UQS82948.1 DHA2 family efflux MFS transporter permease subunit [Bombilactobacillus folatiphilus]